MMRGSNHLIGLINFLTFLLSVPILGGGIWLSTRANNTECLKFLRWPLIVIGISIMVTSLAGLTGSCYRNTFLMSLYLVVVFFIILVLVGFIIFAYVVTEKGSGREVQNRAYLDYYLQDYSGWLEERVTSDSYWRKIISSCVRDSKVCGKLGRTVYGAPETADMFYLRKLTPIQSGCCKPPAECGYNYQNETVVGTNPDCTRWSYDQHLLCYDCDSCKAGVLASLKKTYRNNRKIDNCESCGETRMTKARPG
ncbi:Tetraspanin-3 protein [Spatholobus suberectus]|nr:Tetraspanin-3 protein [Spatholobus suberectus]